VKCKIRNFDNLVHRLNDERHQGSHPAIKPQKFLLGPETDEDRCQYRNKSYCLTNEFNCQTKQTGASF